MPRTFNCFKTNLCRIAHASVICPSSLSPTIKKHKSKNLKITSRLSDWELFSSELTCVKWSLLQTVVISTCQAVKQPHYNSEKLKRNKKEQSQENPEGAKIHRVVSGPRCPVSLLVRSLNLFPFAENLVTITEMWYGYAGHVGMIYIF